MIKIYFSLSLILISEYLYDTINTNYKEIYKKNCIITYNLYKSETVCK